MTFTIPPSLKQEHDELHAELAAATKGKGPVGDAARAVARLEEIVAAEAVPRPGETVRLAVHHFGNQTEADGLAARLAAALPDCPPAQISALPAVLAAHAGLGVLAVIVGRGTGGASLST